MLFRSLLRDEKGKQFGKLVAIAMDIQKGTDAWVEFFDADGNLAGTNEMVAAEKEKDAAKKEVAAAKIEHSRQLVEKLFRTILTPEGQAAILKYAADVDEMDIHAGKSKRGKEGDVAAIARDLALNDKLKTLTDVKEELDIRTQIFQEAPKLGEDFRLHATELNFYAEMFRTFRELYPKMTVPQMFDLIKAAMSSRGELLQTTIPFLEKRTKPDLLTPADYKAFLERARYLAGQTVDFSAAFQLVTDFFNDQKRRIPEKRAAFEKAADWIAEQEKIKTLLQAGYVLTHFDDAGDPLPMEGSDISSWIDNIRRGFFGEDQIAAVMDNVQVLKYDGDIEILNNAAKGKFLRAYAERILLAGAMSETDVSKVLDASFSKRDSRRRYDFKAIEAEIQARIKNPEERQKILDAMNKFPVFKYWEKMGLARDAVNQKRSSEWVSLWFDFVSVLEEAALVEANKFIDTAQLSFAVRRALKGTVTVDSMKSFLVSPEDPWYKKPFSSAQNRRLFRQMRFVGAYHDFAFMDMGPTINNYQRLAGTWNMVFKQLPGTAEVDFGTEVWNAMDQDPVFLQWKTSDREALQRQAIAHFQMIDASFADKYYAALVGKRTQLTEAENQEIWGKVRAAQQAVRVQMKQAVIDSLISRANGEPERAAFRKESLTLRAELLELRGVAKNAWKSRRDFYENNRVLPEGKTEKEIANGLQARYTELLSKIPAGEKGFYPKELDKYTLEALVKEMIVWGYDANDVFYRFVQMSYEGEGAYRRAFKIPDATRLTREQSGEVSAYAEELFKSVGFLVSGEYPGEAEALKRVGRPLGGIMATELARFQDRLVMRDQLKDLFNKKFGNTDQIHENKTDVNRKAYLWATKLQERVKTVKDVEAWVTQAQALRTTAPQLSSSEALALMDTWIDLGIADAPSREKIWDDAQMKSEWDTYRAGLVNYAQGPGYEKAWRNFWLYDPATQVMRDFNAPEFQKLVNERIAKRHISPVQLKALTDQVLKTDQLIRNIIRQQGEKKRSDKSRLIEGIRAISVVDLLFYYDAISNPGEKIDLVGLSVQDSFRFVDSVLIVDFDANSLKGNGLIDGWDQKGLDAIRNKFGKGEAVSKKEWAEALNKNLAVRMRDSDYQSISNNSQIMGRLDNEAKALLARALDSKQPAMAQEEVERLNRRLLEAVYPEQIVKVKERTDKQAWQKMVQDAVSSAKKFELEEGMLPKKFDLTEFITPKAPAPVESKFQQWRNDLDWKFKSLMRGTLDLEKNGWMNIVVFSAIAGALLFIISAIRDLLRKRAGARYGERWDWGYRVYAAILFGATTGIMGIFAAVKNLDVFSSEVLVFTLAANFYLIYHIINIFLQYFVGNVLGARKVHPMKPSVFQQRPGPRAPGRSEARSEVRPTDDEEREKRDAAVISKWKTMPPMPPEGQIQALEELLRPDRDDLGEMQRWVGHLVRVLEEAPSSLKLFLFARDWDSPTSKEDGMDAKTFMLAAMRGAKTVDGRTVDLLAEYGDRVVVFTRGGSIEKPYDYQSIMRWLKTGKNTLEGNISEDIVDPTERAEFEAKWGSEKKWGLWDGHNARKGLEPELDANGRPKKDENGNLVYPLIPVPLIDGVLNNETGEAVPLDGPDESLPPLVRELKNTELGQSKVAHFLVFDAEIGMTGEDVFWTFAKMNDPRNFDRNGNREYGMFQPRQIVRNEGETVQTFNESHAGGSLWFTHGALSRFFKRIRAFGKFGIVVDKYYDDVMKPTKDEPFGPYIGASVRASDMILYPKTFVFTSLLLFIVAPIAVTLLVNAFLGLLVFLLAVSIFPTFFSRWPHVEGSGTSRALLSHDEWEAVFTSVALMNDIVMEDDAKAKPINWLERLYRWIGTFDANSILARARNAHYFRQSNRVFNNVIIRGLFATAIWLVVILVGGAETSVPGLGGVSRPLLGELLYSGTMIALLHTKITGPLMNYFKKLGWGWGSVVAIIMGVAIWKLQLDAVFIMVALSGLVALVAIFLPHGWGTNLYFHIGERELSGTARLKGNIKQTRLKTALFAPLQMGDMINQGGEETAASTGFLLNYLDYSIRYIRKAFSSVYSMLKTKRVTALAQPKIPKETIFDAIRALRRTVTVGLVLLFGMWGAGWMPDAGLGALQVDQAGQFWIALGFTIVFLGNYVHVFSKWIANKVKLANAEFELEKEKKKEKDLEEMAARDAAANGTTIEEEKTRLRQRGQGANLSKAADFEAEIEDAKHASFLNKWDILKTLFHPFVLFAAVYLAPYYGPLLDQHLLGRALPIHLALIGGPFIAFFLGFEFHKTKLLKYFSEKSRPIATLIGSITWAGTFWYYVAMERLPWLGALYHHALSWLGIMSTTSSAEGFVISGSGLGAMLGTNPVFVLLHIFVFMGISLLVVIGAVLGIYHYVESLSSYFSKDKKFRKNFNATELGVVKKALEDWKKYHQTKAEREAEAQAQQPPAPPAGGPRSEVRAVTDQAVLDKAVSMADSLYKGWSRKWFWQYRFRDYAGTKRQLDNLCAKLNLKYSRHFIGLDKKPISNDEFIFQIIALNRLGFDFDALVGKTQDEVSRWGRKSLSGKRDNWEKSEDGDYEDVLIVNVAGYHEIHLVAMARSHVRLTDAQEKQHKDEIFELAGNVKQSEGVTVSFSPSSLSFDWSFKDGPEFLSPKTKHEKYTISLFDATPPLGKGIVLVRGNSSITAPLLLKEAIKVSLGAFKGLRYDTKHMNVDGLNHLEGEERYKLVEKWLTEALRSIPTAARSEVRNAVLADLTTIMARQDALPEKADLIMVFGSPDKRVPVEVAGMWKDYAAKGVTPKILCAGGNGEAQRYQAALVSAGIPENAILIETESVDMKTNAENSEKVLKNAGFDPQDIVFVHAPFHVLRGADAAVKVFGNKIKAIRAAYVPNNASLTDAKVVATIEKQADKVAKMPSIAESSAVAAKLAEYENLGGARSEMRAMVFTAVAPEITLYDAAKTRVA